MNPKAIFEASPAVIIVLFGTAIIFIAMIVGVVASLWQNLKDHSPSDH